MTKTLIKTWENGIVNTIQIQSRNGFAHGVSMQITSGPLSGWVKKEFAKLAGGSVCSFMSTGHKWKSLGKTEHQLKKCPNHMVGKPMLHFLDFLGWWLRWVGSVHCGLYYPMPVVLGAITKQAEQATGSKLLNSALSWTLHQFLNCLALV